MKNFTELGGDRRASDKVRYAVQDFTALNTLASACERLAIGAGDEVDRALVQSCADVGGYQRLRAYTPLANRFAVLNMLRMSPGGRGLVDLSRARQFLPT